MKKMKISKEIKKTKNLSLQTYFLSSYLISNRISPYISSLYIKWNVKPNTITLHMILSGILGAFFFSIDNVFSKVLGAVLIHLWFILDCSDGEVARYTKKFSKYGTELDYVAHLINHPLFGFSIFASLVQLEKYDFYYLLVLFLLSNLMDYLGRNISTLNIVIKMKENQPNTHGQIGNPKKWTIKKVILFITDIFTIYPNFILFGVLIYFVDYFLSSDLLFWYLNLNVILTTLFHSLMLIKLIKKFYTS